jgi:ABC-type multidrug transport system ATPase subunit
MTCALDIQDLQLVQGNRTLAKRFSLQIERGEKIGITGPSGCGKTTLVRSVIRGSLPVGSAATRFDLDRANLSLAYSSQRGGLMPWYTVGQNLQVLCGSKLSRHLSMDNRLATIVTVFGLGNIINSYPPELSGGEHQRLSLAIALFRNADFILVDEPLTGVDMDIKYRIIQYLYENVFLSDKTMLLISHDTDILTLLCNRIVFMREDNSTQLGLSLKDKPTCAHIDDFLYGEHRQYADQKRHELLQHILTNAESKSSCG